MNFLDILFIIILIIFTARGFFRGLVREVISLLSIFLAFTIAAKYNDVLTPHLSVYISNEATIQGISYVLVFLAVLIVCWLVARMLRELLEIALLGWLDRLAGMFFGMLEGTTIVLLTLLVLGSFFGNADFMKNSIIAPKAKPFLARAISIAPDSFRESLRNKGLSIPEQEPLPEIMPDHPDADEIIDKALDKASEKADVTT